jgi:predicted enzyme related to lactoylglutathione lyase
MGQQQKDYPMASGVKVFIYRVEDLDRAKSPFGAVLGAEPAIDSPYYVQLAIGDQRLGLDPNGHTRGFPGSVGYWEVEDTNARFQEPLAAGATKHERPKDIGNGALIASVKDADGNVFGLIQPA